MNFKFSFQTFTGKKEVIYSYEDLKNSDLQKYADNLLKLQEDGVSSVTYQNISYGRVTVELI